MNGTKEAIIGGAYIISSSICFHSFANMVSMTSIRNLINIFNYWGGIPAIIGILGIFFLILGSVYVLKALKK